MSWTRLYLFTALPLALLLAILVPLGEPPDEATHIARAASVLRGELIGHRDDAHHPIDGALVRVAVLVINDGYRAPLLRLPSLPEAPHKPVSWAMLRQAYAAEWAAAPGAVEASNTASYAPVFYFPSAVGLALGGLAGLPAAAVFAGRLANVLACVLGGALALRLAGRTKPFLFALLVLPMTLHLDGSVTQDGPLITAAALAAALLPRGGRCYWGGTVALALVAMAKPAYLPLGVAALVPLDGGPWRLRHAAGFLLACCPALAWSALAAAESVVPFWREAYQPGPLWPGPALPGPLRATDMSAQLRVLLARPGLLVTLPLDTLGATWENLVKSTIGILATLDLLLPSWFYQGWEAALLLAACSTLAVPAIPHRSEGRGFPNPVARAAVLLGAIAALWCAFVLQYLSWTNVGFPAIDGMQGRYLIPILAVATLALPAIPVGSTASRRIRGVLALPVVAIAWIGLAVVPTTVLLRYYVA